jgi:hypothetical protein
MEFYHFPSMVLFLIEFCPQAILLWSIAAA